MASDGTQRPVAITGIMGGDRAQPPMRMELRDMRKSSPDMWNLYLLAMERFQMGGKRAEKNENLPLSYFQISGIHGQPFQKWPASNWNTSQSVWRGGTGYCTHSSNLFLTWHRPYMALYEMQLSKYVTEIANEYAANENAKAYQDAAKKFRMPYWDWALPAQPGDRTLLPWETYRETVHKVIRPGSGGRALPMDRNPLSNYQFGQVGQNLFGRPTTTRDPISDPQSQIQDTIDEKGRNLTERSVWLLYAYDSFSAVNNNLLAQGAAAMRRGRLENFGSIEDIHNSVHVYVGGMMGNPMTSAFDPIFWMHHTNIDRLFAVWQALHVDSKDDYVKPDTTIRNEGSWSITPSMTTDQMTPLDPFTKTESISDGFWSSKDIKSTKTLGYVYPETQDWLYRTPGAIRQQLAKLYAHGSLWNVVSPPWATGGGATTMSLVDSDDVLNSRAMAHLEAPSVAKSTPAAVVMGLGDDEPGQANLAPEDPVKLPADRKLTDLIVENKYLEWLVNIKAEKHSLDGNFFVHVFLGPPEDANPANYVLNQTHVAAFSTFGQNNLTGCGKCKMDQESHAQVTGQIPLTIALAERYLAGLVDGLTTEAVIPFLQRELHWRVTTNDGTPLGRDQVGDLVVAVVTNEVTLPTNPEQGPSYADIVVPRPEVTTNTDASGNPRPRGDGTGYTGPA